MRYITLSLIILLTTAANSWAQKTANISGKIIDEKNAELLMGAVVLVKGTSYGAVADMDGKFTIANVPKGTYTIECSLLSYSPKTITDVIVKEGEVTTLLISLQKTSKTLGVVKITSSARKETNTAILLMQKNSTSVSDGVSAELIKRTPDKNTSDVLKRVSGASIQDNKFAIIRGLNDRYNAAMLNGAPLPSSEPDRKAFAFDIFPANMLDNLIITKTATPDMPAEFAGGIIQINTKDVPEKNFYSLAISSGYNNFTTFKTKLYNNGGSFDWIGVDDGTRAIPSNLPSSENYPIKILTQAQYAEKTNFDWAIYNDKKFAPNLSLQYSMGVVKQINKKPLALILALTYSKSNSYTETIRRTFENPDTSASVMVNDYLDKVYSTQILAGALANFSFKYNKNNSFSFKNLFSINSDNRITNRTGAPDATMPNPIVLKSNNRFFISNKIYTGQLSGEHYEPKSRIRFSWLASLSEIQRNIPNERRTIYTRRDSISDPEYPNPLDTVWIAGVSASNVGPDYSGGMFWSENKEQVRSAKLNFSRAFDLGKEIKNEIKVGMFLQTRERNFYARRLGYTKYGGSGSSVKFKDSLLYLPEEEIFLPVNMGRLEMVGNTTKVGGFKLTEATKPNDTYTASSKLNAFYLMLDNKYKFLRLIWGVRYEGFQQFLDARRSINKDEDVHLNTIKKDVLPSANFVIALNKKQNIRLAYSQTVNRPEYRELAPFAFYDFNTKLITTGSDTLRRALIHNADIRYEIYPGRGQLFSVSGFYKKFIDPIEQILAPYAENEISFANLPSAQNYGAELEFRVLLAALFKKDSVKILNNITAFSNLSVIRSTVNTGGKSGIGDSIRPLQGQSPYVFNAGVQYLSEKNGISISLNFNRVGARIYVVGNENEAALWEAPRSFLDFQLAKSLWKNKIEIKLNAQNIVAQNQNFYQNRTFGETSDVKGFETSINKIFVGDAQNKNEYKKGVDDLRWSSKLGAVYSISLSIKL
jgi:TonB-dependent receptor